MRAILLAATAVSALALGACTVHVDSVEAAHIDGTPLNRSYSLGSSPIVDQEFKITVTPAQYSGFFKKPLHLQLATDLPSGKLTLRAGVFDTAASKAGTLETPISIPKK